MKIVLIGYMGSGKSVFGKLLAGETGLSFIDLDEEIEKREGVKLQELFRTKGEIYFRKLENRVLKEILSSGDSFVMATGGGTPCYGDSMETIKNAPNTTSVYLKSSVTSLASRLFPERGFRPLIAHLETMEKLQEFIGIHLFERAHFYNRADVSVETENKSPEEIVSELKNLLF